MTVQIDEHSRSTFNVGARATTTDAEGRFAFARLPRENVYLKVTGESILPLDWARKADGGIAAAAHGKVDEIAIVVALRYHLQVEVDAGSADEVRVVDADGKPVAINVFEGNATMSLDSLPLLAGRSKVMVVGEEARTLVLSKEGQEARRMPLALRPGELNVVR
jgi:hypothetical protein